MNDHVEHRRAAFHLAMVTLILLAGLIAYWNSFEGTFILDDADQILGNTAIHSLWPVSKVIAGTRRPVWKLTLAANYAIGRYEVFGYHLFNLVVHLAAGLTLFGLVRRTLRLPSLPPIDVKSADLLALAMAVIWLVHPLQTQSVTYIAQRTESMMGLFYLLCLYCVLRASQVPRAWPWCVGAVAACWLGMGTKEVMVTAPLVVLLYDRVFLSDSWSKVMRQRWGIYLAFLAAALVLIVDVVNITKTTNLLTAGFQYKEITKHEYLATQGGVILHYLRLVFWPEPLCLDYGWTPARTLLEIFLPCTIVTMLLVASCAAFRRRPALGFLGLSFFLILAPTSSFMPIADLAVEHRMYLPLAPVVILVVFGFCTLAGRVLPHGFARNAGVGGTLLVVVLILMARTIDRNTDYHDPVTMWKDVLLTAKRNPRAYNNLGIFVSKNGDAKQAMKYFQEAIKINEDYAAAYNNLGAVLSKRGQNAAAAQLFARALGIDPKYARAHYNMGSLLAKQGKMAEASIHYERAISIQPRYPNAHYNLGRVYVAQKRLHQAVEHFREALRITPDFLDAANHLAAAYAETGQWDKAVTTAQKAVAIAERARRPDLIKPLEARLRLYQKRIPYRDQQNGGLDR